jgi:hypothetical protein
MKSIPSFRSLLKAWTSNRLMFVSSLVVVPAVVILIVVSATQPGITVDTLTPGANSSKSPEENQDSASTDSGEPESEASSASPSPSGSASPSSSSSGGNVGNSPSSGGSTTSTRSPTPFVESASQAEAKQAAAVYLNQEYQYSRPLFSRVVIIQMLRDDGYTLADATYAAGAVSHDWSAEAALMANDLIGNSYYSRSGLIAELRSENFTSSEASYAAVQLENSYPEGYYWATLWLDQASNYLNEETSSGSNFSEVEANEFLRTAGYTSAEVTAVLADISEYSWETFALYSAWDYYYGPGSPTREQVENHLRGRSFTQSQIDYAMEGL